MWKYSKTASSDCLNNRSTSGMRHLSRSDVFVHNILFHRNKNRDIILNKKFDIFTVNDDQRMFIGKSRLNKLQQIGNQAK